jgi:hypothetical protein
MSAVKQPVTELRRLASIISKLINTRTSVIQHLYCDMILVAVTMIFWVSVMNKYIMFDNFGM